MRQLRTPLLFAATAALFFFSLNTRALVIAPTFDSSITSDPNATKIEAAINAAIQVYQTNFSDAVTVKILFKQMTSGLGQSSTYYDDVPYSSFLSLLQSRATTTNDVIALAHLPSGPTNPVNGHALIRSALASLRMLGFPDTDLPPGYYDSTISINMSLCNLDRVTIDPNKCDLMVVAMHEMDEALGTSSSLPRGSECRAVDLFRYSSTGARTYTTAGDDAYFSLDGTTQLARYNQDSRGDFGDWWSVGAHTPQVQDAFGTRGAIPDLGVELIVLDAIGWTRTVSPSAVTTPAFQSVTQTSNTITFMWNAIPGRSYQIQYTTNLAWEAWTDLGVPIIASGATATSSDTINSDPQRFYRVELLAESPMTTTIPKNNQSFINVRTLKMETREFRREEKGK